MISKFSQAWREYPYFISLVLGLCFVMAIGVGLSVFVFVKTGVVGGEFTRSVCFSNDCVERFFDLFEQSFVILDGTLQLLVGLATIGGIVVALMSYLSGVSATALSNHISHFSIFQQYMASEIAKRSRISPSSVDVFVWYNLIFSESRAGKTTISDQYCQAVMSINREIAFSNDQAKTAVQGSFRYMPHQQRVIDVVSALGISLTHQPRNDFYEIEDQVFSLISSVNKSFCYSNSIPDLLRRNYV